ncbi:hypothetical protein ACFV6Z_29825 [Streptomyces sp. NPDC059818]|uniref:hypothetical protein n=1 Tax=Streptomyces sp. NPDC059818 TaxID=3346962 RepID=UPI00365572F4
MAGRLTECLSTLAGAGEALRFDAVGLTAPTVEQEAADVAAGPYAALLAEAIAHACGQDAEAWRGVAGCFATGLAAQQSFLHLTSSLETLLDSPGTVQVIAGPLNNALLSDFTHTVSTGPLLASARLEGAVRLAASDAVSPFKVWGTLDGLGADAPEDFLERVPRIVGVAMDCWAGEQTLASALRQFLEQLSAGEAGEVDALFELGCDRLRTALASRALPDVTRQVTEARRYFASAAQAEEARDDATVYTAVCDALLGFTAGDSTRVASAAETIDRALDRRSAWLLRTHQPTWMQPRLSAEIAWSRLLLQLRAAGDLLQQPVWMDAWQALDAVLSAYRAARTVQPVGGSDLTGLSALVEPAIEDGFLKQQSFLAALQHAAHQPSPHPQDRFDTATADLVLHRIRSRSQGRAAQTASPAKDDAADDGRPGRDADRVHRLAPTFALTLGPEQAQAIAGNLDDRQLAALEGIAHTSDVARLKSTDPLIVPQLDRIVAELSAFPAFTGAVRQTFGALVEQTLLFLKSRADLTRTSLLGAGKNGERPYDYRRKPQGRERKPLEADLQRDFHGWLQACPLHGCVSVEPIDVALGRADVMVHFGALRYLTEIKMDAVDNSRAYLEGKYLAQAAEYTNANAPFGQLLVLDLTDKSAGTRRIDELTWVTAHRPDGALIDRAVVAGVVTGNRVTPSGYSR